MRSIVIFAVLGLFLAGSPAGADESEGGSALSVSRIGVGTAVVDRELRGEAGSFPAEVGQVVCLTRVEGAGEPTRVTHVWLSGGEERRSIELDVRSSSWRTWSRKNVTPGEWTVRVLDADGVEISSASFTVGP